MNSAASSLASSISTLLSPKASSVPDLNIVILGHVDHGKSTLIGRLLHDSGTLADGRMEQIRLSCERRGMPFEWAFLMDALQAERDQNVTIDTARIWLNTPLRRYCLIDAPGHREFLRNMITGAASADAALLLVDATEGMKEQSRRHAGLLAWLGIKQVVVLVNKMDLAKYELARFEVIKKECTDFLKQLDIEPMAIIPISAQAGDNVAERSSRMSWYEGESILETLDQFSAPENLDNGPLRFNVQDIYRFDSRRIIAGRIESGTLKVGDKILFSPSNMSSVVKSFESWPQAKKNKKSAGAKEAVGITLEDQIFVERGHIGSTMDNVPVLNNRIPARLFWLHYVSLQVGNHYQLRLGSAEYKAEVQSIERLYDSDDLTSGAAEHVARHQAADVVLRLKGLAAFDDFRAMPTSGRFVLFDGHEVAGGGIIHTDNVIDLRSTARKTIKSTFLGSEDFGVTPDERAIMNGHRGGVLWFTGLSGAGKSTLARELQKRLFSQGYQVTVLDGDNVRRGLCSDLGFSHTDRSENIRRVGEVASLFAEAGFIVITAFISPYADDRRRARAMAPHDFHTIHIKADISLCEQRDTKGLYAKARAGEIKDFTGISSPYEEPEQPDLVIDTANNDIVTCADMLMRYVQKSFDVVSRQEAESYSI